MKILTRMCTSLGGYVTSTDGLPIQLAFPAWDAGALGFTNSKRAAMPSSWVGRPSSRLGAPFWPWGDLAVYVLSSHPVAGSPDHVVFDDDPARLVERVRDDGKGATSIWLEDPGRSTRFWRSVPSVNSACSYSPCSPEMA